MNSLSVSPFPQNRDIHWANEIQTRKQIQDLVNRTAWIANLRLSRISCSYCLFFSSLARRTDGGSKSCASCLPVAAGFTIIGSSPPWTTLSGWGKSVGNSKLPIVILDQRFRNIGVFRNTKIKSFGDLIPRIARLMREVRKIKRTEFAIPSPYPVEKIISLRVASFNVRRRDKRIFFLYCRYCISSKNIESKVKTFEYWPMLPNLRLLIQNSLFMKSKPPPVRYVSQFLQLHMLASPPRLDNEAIGEGERLVGGQGLLQIRITEGPGEPTPRLCKR